MKNPVGLIRGGAVKRRREELGLSQEYVAERVRKITGERFSQQSLAKFESRPGAKSTFAEVIARVLDEADPNVALSIAEPVGIAVYPTVGTPTAGQIPSREKMLALVESLSADQLVEFIKMQAEFAPAGTQLRIAQALIDNALQSIPSD